MLPQPLFCACQSGEASRSVPSVPVKLTGPTIVLPRGISVPDLQPGRRRGGRGPGPGAAAGPVWIAGIDGGDDERIEVDAATLRPEVLGDAGRLRAPRVHTQPDLPERRARRGIRDVVAAGLRGLEGARLRGAGGVLILECDDPRADRRGRLLRDPHLEFVCVREG